MTRKQVTQGSEVLPPWKQAGYVSEASYTRMIAGATQVQTTSTRVQMEQRWEGSAAIQQQAGAVKEVKNFQLGNLTFNLSACYATTSFLQVSILCKCLFVSKNACNVSSNNILELNSTCI